MRAPVFRQVPTTIPPRHAPSASAFLQKSDVAQPATPMRPPAQGEGSGALSRELADFLIELSIALHKNAIYPEGHPLLAGAVAYCCASGALVTSRCASNSSRETSMRMKS